MSTLEVSVRAGVPYLVVWNVKRGVPVSTEHAKKIREVTFELTGVRYIGPLAVSLGGDHTLKLPMQTSVFR